MTPALNIVYSVFNDKLGQIKWTKIISVATLCYKNEISVFKIFLFNIFSTPEVPKSLKVKIKNSNIMYVCTYVLLNC